MDAENRGKNKMGAERKETWTAPVAPMYFGAAMLGSPMMRRFGEEMAEKEKEKSEVDKENAKAA